MSCLPLARLQHKQRKIIHAAGVAFLCAAANCVFNINEVETCNYSGQSAAGTGACFLNTRGALRRERNVLSHKRQQHRQVLEQFSRRGRTFDL
jgi:hypothetical protein